MTEKPWITDIIDSLFIIRAQHPEAMTGENPLYLKEIPQYHLTLVSNEPITHKKATTYMNLWIRQCTTTL